MNKKDFFEMMKRSQEPLKMMIDMIPEDKLAWRPADSFMNVGQLLKHLSENWGFVKMMVTETFPEMSMEQMEEMMKLENLPACTKKEAITLMEKDLEDTIAFLENEVSEDDFFNKMTVAPWGFKGETWKAVLMAKDHLMNHKMQLHLYLKLLGLPVNTGTLYGM